MSLTCVVVVSAGGWLWFMEFGLTCGCSTRCAVRVKLVLLVILVVGSSWFPTLIEVCDGWSIGGFDFGWWGVWLVVIVNDEWWFVDLRLMIGFGCGLLVTCYLVLMFFVLCDLVNCRVVWGLDHKAGAGRVVGYWLLMVFWLEIGVNHVFSGDQVGLLMNCCLVEVMVWIGGWGWSVVVSWGSSSWWIWHWLLVSVWWCDSVVEVVIVFQRSLGRVRRGDRVVVLLRLLRLLMLYVELVWIFIGQVGRLAEIAVFGIIVRFADWLIDFYLKWCGVWWFGSGFAWGLRIPMGSTGNW